MAPQQMHNPPIVSTPVAGHARLLWMTALLYLVQGVPIGLAFQAYPVLLRQGGAPLELIALVPLSSLPWAFKFFWSPLVENRWSAAMGRRRSWIVPMQLLLALCLAAMAFQRFDAEHAPALLWLIAAASLASATQDIATDGLAADVLHGSGIAHINALQVGCFMLGMLVGGPAVLLGVDVLGQAASMLALAAIVVLCGVPVWRWREGAAATVLKQRASLRGFFRRPLALRLMFAGMLATLTTLLMRYAQLGQQAGHRFFHFPEHADPGRNRHRLGRHGAGRPRRLWRRHAGGRGQRAAGHRHAALGAPRRHLPGERA
jgi:hypothetical protein